MKVVIASFKVLREHENSIKAELGSVMEETTREPGNQVYSIQQADDDPLHWIVYEVYRNQDAIDAHMRSSYVQAFLEKLQSMVSEPPRVEFLELHGSIGF